MAKPRFIEKLLAYLPKQKTVSLDLTPSKPFPLTTWNNDLMEKQLHPYYGVVSGMYYAMTGMPWLSSDARKAVMTEWFWQPIRGQPRRVDTNELRKYSNTVWVQSIVMTILNQLCSIPWDVIPKEGLEYKDVEKEIDRIKPFFENPNKNCESFNDLIRAWLKDVLEIDAGVLVKVFTVDSYDFEHLEPRSGAPLLKPLICPECGGEKEGEEKSFKQKAERTLRAIDFMEKTLPESKTMNFDKETKKEYKMIKPDYSGMKTKLLEIVSYNSPSDANAIGFETEELPKKTSCPYCNGTGKGRQLTELYARDGASFLKDSDRTGWTYGYWQYSYAIPAHPMWFNRDEIVYFMQNQRSMSGYGYSAVQSSLETIKALEYSVKHNMALFIDGAVPDGVVSVEDMDDKELIRMKAAWENELKGQPHKIVFLNKKTTFAPFAFNNRDMQFLEGQREMWNQVISNFNMNPIDLGITRDVNRSTAASQIELTRRKAIRPLMKKIEELINDQIMPELGAENTKFAYIVDDPVEERKEAELGEIYLRNGLKTINEIRIEMGLQPVEWGNDNPIEQKAVMGAGMGARGQVTGRASEVKEERPADNEAERRSKPEENKTKGYQYPFQPQVPFLTSTQNLSTAGPFALPKKGHVNTQYPYNEIAGRCPGCGKPTVEQIPAVAGSMSEPWYHCISCDRKWAKSELDRVIAEMENLQGQNSKAPSIDPAQTNMVTAPIPNLIAQRVQEYTQTLGYPQKKKLRQILTKGKNVDMVADEIYELGFDQVTSLEIATKAGPFLKELEKDIRKEKLLKKGTLLIDNFNDFVRIVEGNENRMTFNQVQRFVEEDEEKFTFRYADGKYAYECDVPKKDIVNPVEFNDRFVRTATPAKKRKRKIIIEG